MDTKLFEILPYNFFQLFNSSSRVTFANILYLLYFQCEQENSYTFSKDNFIKIIEEYFNTNFDDELIQEDASLNNSRDKANWVFRKLKGYGWIDTEYGVDGELNVNFEDYAIAFLNTFVNFETEHEIELSSYVYRIYQNIKFIDPKRMYFVLKDSINQAEDLIRKLRSLNSNIKKYINNVTNFDQKSDEEQLSAILDQLLNDYKLKVIDNAYFYMKTHDNPIKYKTKFINNCEKIHYDEYQSKLVINQIMDEENVDLPKASQKFEEIMCHLESVFDRIIFIMDEIDRKNSKYINVAIEKIRILMNNNSDMEGQLLFILKNYNYLKEEDINFLFSNSRNITKMSLFTPRKNIKVKASMVKVRNHNQTFDDSYLMNSLKKSKQYSLKEIKKFINDLLKENGQVTINNFNIRNNNDLIKLILLFVYSESKNNNYKIKWLDDEIFVDGACISNFNIERK